MEDKVVEALQHDTIKHIQVTKITPLEIRVKNLERDKNMVTS